MPRKPSRPLQHLVFPKKGSVQHVVEALPANKEELESVIVGKFITALESRFGRRLALPTKGEEWPDFWTSEDSKRIGIELVEVVNPEHIAAGGYGVAQSVAIDRARQLVWETVQGKLAKRYSAPREWSLWLLAYDVTRALVGQDVPAARLAHDNLRSKSHPFTEIWLIWPAAEDVPSSLESVWPTTEFTSTAAT